MTTQRGFTLLEALIALAILAIALTATFRALAATAVGAADIRQRSAAEWVAQNLLAELRATDAFPDIGHSEGSTPLGHASYHWHQEVEDTPNAAFRRVDLTISDSTGQHVLARLSGFATKPVE